MVNYIPPPNPDLIFPQPGPGKGALFGQGLAQGMGDWPKEIGGIFQQMQKKKQEQDLIAKMTQMFSQQGGAPQGPANTPMAGMGGAMTKSATAPQQPMMDQRLSQIMPLLIQLGISNPHLVPLLSHMMGSMIPKQSATPRETWFLNNKTGEPSMVPKDGFDSLPPQPAGSFVQANRMFINRTNTETNRAEGHETHRIAMEMHVKDHMDNVKVQTSDAIDAFEQAYRLSNQVPRISSTDAIKSREVASGKGGWLERAMSSDKAVEYYRKIGPLAAKLTPLMKLATPRQKNDLITMFPEPHDSDSEKMQKRRVLRQTIKDIESQERKRVMEREMMIRHQKDTELDAMARQDFPAESNVSGTSDAQDAHEEFGDQDIATTP